MESLNSDVLKEHRFLQAITNINRRAEKQTDTEKLVQVFVETDLPTRCETTDHQIILGRRGTGKTHLLRYFQYQKQLRGEVVYFADCRYWGSGIPSSSENLVVIASKYFSAFLNDLGTYLLDHAIRLEGVSSETEDRILHRLSEGLVSFMSPQSGDGISVFNYRQIADTMTALLEDLDIKNFFIVIDEWAQIPIQAQPYVAEFIKRAILTVPTISLKILAVNYQCRFSANINQSVIGMQRGADFTDVIDIEQDLVFDANRPQVINFFSQLLYNHLGAELNLPLSVSTDEKFDAIKRLFTQEPAFVELVRAAEGNCRDFICTFAKAYIEGYRSDNKARTIGIPHIQNAALSWYANEKEANIKDEQEVQETINYLVDKVLKDYKSRTFMVEVGLDEHPRLMRLLNERILHRLNHRYSHPDRPGLRYELFTLDYGAYVAYRGTVNEPNQLNLFSGDVRSHDSNDKKIVPYDDKRSIRRIVFDPNMLSVKQKDL